MEWVIWLWVGVMLFRHPTVDSLPPTPAVAKEQVRMTFHTEYEVSGHFDKDAQGWCATRITLECKNGQQVNILDWYDENGHVVYEHRYQGQVLSTQGSLIEIQLHQPTPTSSFYISSTGVCYYDLGVKRLLQEPPQKPPVPCEEG